MAIILFYCTDMPFWGHLQYFTKPLLKRFVYVFPGAIYIICYGICLD